MSIRRNWVAAILLAAFTAGLAVHFGLDASKRAHTDITLPDLDGNTRSIAAWRGQIVVLNFWATWCAPCREEIPALQAVDADYRSKGVQIVGIALDSVANSREFVEKLGIAYPILVGDAATLAALPKLGNSKGGLPFTLVLDRSGRVARTHLGRIERDALERILGELLG